MNWNKKEKKLFLIFGVSVFVCLTAEVFFQIRYGITNIGVIGFLYLMLCGLWDLWDLKSKE